MVIYIKLKTIELKRNLQKILRNINIERLFQSISSNLLSKNNNY